MTRHSMNDRHMMHTGKSILMALYGALGIFLLLLVSFRIGGAIGISSLAKSTLEDFNAGIARDLGYIKEHGDAIAASDTVKRYILAKDNKGLSEFISKEAAQYSLGPTSVTNKDGVVLGRTAKLGIRGDNVFLTIPEGRVVSQGKSVAGIEQGTINPNQIRMSTGRPVLDGGVMIGAVFTSLLMNDDYAVRFRDSYLPTGAQVLFYTKDQGVFGDSFKDPAQRKIINAYFNSGSDWIRHGMNEKTVSFDGVHMFLVENVIFEGIEKSPGGALVFIPRVDISISVDITIAVLTLLAFISIALVRHIRSKNEEGGWRYVLLMMLISVLMLPLIFFTLKLQHTALLRLSRIPYTLYNSTLRLQPDFGIYDVDFEQTFSIIADTGDESINVVQIGLLFDPQAVEVKSLEAASSTCSYVIEKNIDAKAGKANLTCGLPKSEGERGSLPVASVTVVPRRIGTFTLSFDPVETRVLASDGLGTDVLRMSQSGSYRVDKFNLSTSTADTVSATSTVRSFVVFSPTHPNQSRWYNSPTLSFIWRGRPEAVYYFEFDNLPDTTPLRGHTIQGSTIDLHVPGDGIFYFHLRLASGGPTAHYTVQVDRTPPTIASMDPSADKVVEGDVVRFHFEAIDIASGVQRNYYVDLGNHLFLPIGSQLFVPFLESGDQTIVLRVYDSAGNYSESTKVVHVEAK